MSGTDYATLVKTLQEFPTRQALQSSPFYQQHQAQLDQIINQIWQQNFPATAPRLKHFLRFTHWNIERGRNFEAIVKTFNTHPTLRAADIITLNEVDLGMNRTNNRNVAFELGTYLKMHSVFVAEYLELTKGVNDEKELPGENKQALHGNAILSRYPISRIAVVRLPCCFDTFGFSEKRYGERVGLMVALDLAKVHPQALPLVVVTSHLEVRNNPKCRERQFKVLLAAIEQFTKQVSLDTQLNRTGPIKLEEIPVIIGGDFNTLTFSRGGRYHTTAAILRLLRSNPDKIADQLRHPAPYEPLFATAESQGFDYQAYNDDRATCSAILQGVEESSQLPEFIQRQLRPRLAPYRQLDFRLDFFFGRGLYVLRDQEIQDQMTISRRPQTFSELETNHQPISDHHPISCDCAIPLKFVPPKPAKRKGWDSLKMKRVWG
jgi:endonuclease/exonuclease/phosphatase family metal-dependent hydrolase